MPPGRVRRNTWAPGRLDPLYVAATQGSEIIGFNAFIAHRLMLNGQELLGYQSCWTATSSAHRGKKIFQNLILTAQEILLARGAAFVFGFPNSASHPIFLGKLGYRETPSVKWQMPNLPFAPRLFQSPNAMGLDRHHLDAILQDDVDLIALKRNEPIPEVKLVEHAGSLCWGVRRQRTLAGIRVSYLDVGGIKLADSAHLPRLISLLLGEFPKVLYAQLVSIEGAPYNRLFNGVRPSQSNVLIVRDLNVDTSGLRFNFFGGVRDVF